MRPPWIVFAFFAATACGSSSDEPESRENDAGGDGFQVDAELVAAFVRSACDRQEECAAIPPGGDCPRYTADQIEGEVTALMWSNAQQAACRDARLAVLACLDAADCSAVVLGPSAACPEEVSAYVGACRALNDALNAER